METLKINIRMNEAALTIQKFFKYINARRKFLVYMNKRIAAANKIRRNWRAIRHNKIVNSVKMHKVNRASLIMQKFMKGFKVVEKDMYEDLKEIKLNKPLREFGLDSLKRRIAARRIVK